MADRSEPTFFVLARTTGSANAARLDLTDQVLDFQYDEDEEKADLLKLKVRNWDLSNFDDPVWKQGTRLTVAWGYPGNMSTPREVTIQKVTGFKELSVEAQGKETDMNKVTKSRSWTNMSRAEVARQIAVEHGYDPNDLDIEDTEVTCEVITQARMTDAQFLRRLANIEGFEFFDDVDGLHFHQRRLGQKPRKVVTYYADPGVGDIIDVNVTNDIFAKPEKKAGKVTAKARNPETKKDIEATGSDATTERDKVAPVEVIIDPATGTFAEKTAAPQPGPPAASEEVRPTTQTDPKMVKREVDGSYKKGQLQAVELKLKLVGDPQLKAKEIIEVRGISKLLSGLYYIKAISNKLGNSGFTQELKCSSDGTQGHAQGGTGGGKSAQSVEACAADLAAAQARLSALQASIGAGTPTAAQQAQLTQAQAEVTELTKRCQLLSSTQSKGKVNEKKPDEAADPNKLREEEVIIDPATGEFAVQYGKPKAGGSGGKQTK